MRSVTFVSRLSLSISGDVAQVLTVLTIIMIGIILISMASVSGM